MTQLQRSRLFLAAFLVVGCALTMGEASVASVQDTDVPASVVSNRFLRGRVGGTVEFGGKRGFGNKGDSESTDSESVDSEDSEDSGDEDMQGYEDIETGTNEEEEVDTITSGTYEEPPVPTDEELAEEAAGQHEIVSGFTVPEVTVVVPAKEKKTIQASGPKPVSGGPMAANGKGKNNKDKLGFVVVSSPGAVDDSEEGLEGSKASDVFINYDEIEVIDLEDEEPEEGVLVGKTNKKIKGVVYQENLEPGEITPPSQKPKKNKNPLSTVQYAN